MKWLTSCKRRWIRRVIYGRFLHYFYLFFLFAHHHSTYLYIESEALEQKTAFEELTSRFEELDNEKAQMELQYETITNQLAANKEAFERMVDKDELVRLHDEVNRLREQREAMETKNKAIVEVN